MAAFDFVQRALLLTELTNCGSPEPEKAADSLDLLCAELLRWGKVHNLTGHTEPGQVLTNLFLDALYLVPLVKGESLLDIGSGAGFPGLVLALALPGLKVTLLEPRAKRVSFQRRVIGLLGLESRVSAVRGRSPETSLDAAPFSTITLRAVSGLETSLDLARPYLAPGGAVLLPRAGGEADELSKAGLEVHPYRLPSGGGDRLIAVFSPK